MRGAWSRASNEKSRARSALPPKGRPPRVDTRGGARARDGKDRRPGGGTARAGEAWGTSHGEARDWTSRTAETSAAGRTREVPASAKPARTQATTGTRASSPVREDTTDTAGDRASRRLDERVPETEATRGEAGEEMPSKTESTGAAVEAAGTDPRSRGGRREDARGTTAGATPRAPPGSGGGKGSAGATDGRSGARATARGAGAGTAATTATNRAAAAEGSEHGAQCHSEAGGRRSPAHFR